MRLALYPYAVRCGFLVASVSCLLSVSACETESATQEPYISDLTDRSYAAMRHTRLVSATGEAIALSHFAGDFVWLDYAAPWCSTCDPQSRAISALERSLGHEVVFLTVITSDKNLNPATPQIANNWARRYNLEASQVMVGAWTRFLPAHVLFSPTGQTLYRHTGLLTAEQIKGILRTHMESWMEY